MSTKPKTWTEITKAGGLKLATEVRDFTRAKDGKGTIVVYRASTGIRDRDDESISIKGDGLGRGWVWNESKLPAHLFGHDSRTAQNWIGKGTRVWTAEDGLYYETELFDKSPSPIADIARQIAWIAEEHPDALSSSVGFQPLKWRDPNGQIYSVDNPGASYPWGTPGRRYVEQELLEHSAVPVPSNIESLAIAVRGLITRAGGPPEAEPSEPETLEQFVALAIERAAELERFLAKANDLLPEDTTPVYDADWLRIGVKHPISRPSQKAGAALSREQFDRLTSAKDAMTAFVASATPAEEAA
jgi:hypothetical protein